MKGRVYAINEGTSAQFFGVMFYDGEEWRVSQPYKTHKSRSGAERAIIKRGGELTAQERR
jgi:hypothetical protein